jgi:arylformamidase
MKTYDISLTITPTMAVWPDDPQPLFERVSKIEEGRNANGSNMSMSVHTGTHVDAPYHFLQDGSTVEKMPLDVLIGRVYVAHIPDNVNVITPVELEAADIPPRTRRVLIRTRNSKYWSKEPTKFQEDFVGVDAAAAEYLVKRGVKLIGIDYLSVAPYKNSKPTHVTLLKAGVVILEGLNLSQVSRGRYNLICLPLKLEGRDGSPARAVLIGV